VSALEQLRENLREAARREIELNPARPRRRRRRATGLVAIALLGGAAAAATAGELLSVGEPVPDTREHAAGFQPVDRLDIAAANGGYGVAIYTAQDGKHCAIAGNVNGRSLGVVQDGTFRPYARGRSGACNTPGRPFSSQLKRDGRTIVFGRAPGKRIRVEGEAKLYPTYRGGAFLLVFEGSERPGMSYVDAQ
jgi:hypothetical protein